MKILCIEPRDKVRHNLTKLFESRFDLSVIPAKSANDAVKLIQRNPKAYNLIVTENKMVGGDGTYLYQKIRNDLRLGLPIIFFASTPLGENDFLGEVLESDDGMEYFTKSSEPERVKQLLKYVQEFLHFSFFLQQENTEEEVAKEKIDFKLRLENIDSVEQRSFRSEVNIGDESFCSFEGTKLYPLKSAPCDIFIKLGQKKLVKLCHQNDNVTTSLLEKYINKGIEQFFVPDEDVSKVEEAISNVLSEVLVADINDDLTQAAQLVSFDFINKQMASVGMTSATIKLAEKTVQSVVDFAEKDKNLLEMIKKCLQNKNYISEHSLMTSYVCTQIARQMGMANEQILQKLSVASLMHDAFLSHETLSKVKHAEEIEKLNPQSREMVLSHPQLAATAVNAIKDFQADVDTILAQHHERPLGKGFPKGLNSKQIAPLSCLFIIAEEFVERLFVIGFDPEKVTAILDSLEEEFNQGNFQKPLAALIKGFSH
jgi:response regulator RpfG family c-di-GMP phosphodiesterase